MLAQPALIFFWQQTAQQHLFIIYTLKIEKKNSKYTYRRKVTYEIEKLRKNSNGEKTYIKEVIYNCIKKTMSSPAGEDATKEAS